MSRPSDLTTELTLQIRNLVLEGKKYLEIQKELEIPANTWDAWVYKDYKDFRKDLNSWRKERLIKKSERLSEEILDLNYYKEDSKIDADLLRIKQRESEFVRNTLGKEDYSTRQEHTGKDGEPLKINVIQYGDNNSTPVSAEELPTTDTTSTTEV